MQLFAGRLDKQQAEARFGGRFESELRLEITALRALRMIRDSGSALELTEQGYYLWVVLMREFFSGINQLREQMRHRRPV